MDILGYVASALGGGLFTALTFVFAQSNQISSMRTEIKAIAKQLEAHINSPPTCTFHQSIASATDVSKVEVEGLKSRINQLENWRQGKVT